MGNLHEGHLALVRQAKPLGDVTVATIFVNRLQFGPQDDFDTYPRTLAADCAQLEAAGCDVVFAPTEQEFYPEPQTFRVTPPAALTDVLEGAFRPGFFAGVCTVVLKLLSCTRARTAVFGKKDYQQLTVIRRLVEDLHLPIKIVGVPTVREADGLARSSRNAYLSAIERPLAGALFAALNEAASALDRGLTAYDEIAQEGRHVLESKGFEVDYFAIRCLDDLAIPAPLEPRLVILVAARLGRTRLIDNLIIQRG